MGANLSIIYIKISNLKVFFSVVLSLWSPAEGLTVVLFHCVIEMRV